MNRFVFIDDWSWDMSLLQKILYQESIIEYSCIDDHKKSSKIIFMILFSSDFQYFQLFWFFLWFFWFSSSIEIPLENLIFDFFYEYYTFHFLNYDLFQRSFLKIIKSKCWLLIWINSIFSIYLTNIIIFFLKIDLITGYILYYYEVSEYINALYLTIFLFFI